MPPPATECQRKIGVVMVDSHRSSRELLARELSRENGYQILGGAGTGPEAVKVCARTKPHLVIMDLLMSGLSSAEVIRSLRQQDTRTRFFIYTAVRSRDLIAEILRERPHGFVRKQDSLTTLLEGLRVTSSGGSYFTEFATSEQEHLRGDEQTNKLTPRECAVLRMVAHGMRSKEIASELRISLKTAEHHRANLMGKLNIHEVAGLTCYAIRQGYVDVDHLQ